MKKSVLRLALICLSAELIACAGAPPMPDIEIKMIDAVYSKAHVYLLPKTTDAPATLLRSEALSLLGLDMYYAISPENYVKLEEYASKVEQYAKDMCK